MPLGAFALSSDAIGGSSQGGARLYVVTGIASTLVVGVPYSAYAISESATGIASTLIVGTPAADFTKRYIVTGVKSLVTGTPAARYPQWANAWTCGKTTQFGRPSRIDYNYAASASLGAKVGTPKANAKNRTCTTGAVQSSAIGNPSGKRSNTGMATGVASSTIGSPTCLYAQFGIVTGIHSTVIGTIRYPLAFEDFSVTVLTRANRVEVFTDV